MDFPHSSDSDEKHSGKMTLIDIFVPSPEYFEQMKAAHPTGYFIYFKISVYGICVLYHIDRDEQKDIGEGVEFVTPTSPSSPLYTILGIGVSLFRSCYLQKEWQERMVDMTGSKDERTKATVYCMFLAGGMHELCDAKASYFCDIPYKFGDTHDRIEKTGTSLYRLL